MTCAARLLEALDTNTTLERLWLMENEFKDNCIREFMAYTHIHTHTHTHTHTQTDRQTHTHTQTDTDRHTHTKMI